MAGRAAGHVRSHGLPPLRNLPLGLRRQDSLVMIRFPAGGPARGPRGSRIIVLLLSAWPVNYAPRLSPS
jgi:hypothetical protein